MNESSTHHRRHFYIYLSLGHNVYGRFMFKLYEIRDASVFKRFFLIFDIKSLPDRLTRHYMCGVGPSIQLVVILWYPGSAHLARVFRVNKV